MVCGSDTDCQELPSYSAITGAETDVVWNVQAIDVSCKCKYMERVLQEVLVCLWHS